MDRAATGAAASVVRSSAAWPALAAVPRRAPCRRHARRRAAHTQPGVAVAGHLPPRPASAAWACTPRMAAAPAAHVCRAAGGDAGGSSRGVGYESGSESGYESDCAEAGTVGLTASEVLQLHGCVAPEATSVTRPAPESTEHESRRRARRRVGWGKHKGVAAATRDPPGDSPAAPAPPLPSTAPPSPPPASATRT